jgi:hypothetical protein
MQVLVVGRELQTVTLSSFLGSHNNKTPGVSNTNTSIYLYTSILEEYCCTIVLMHQYTSKLAYCRILTYSVDYVWSRARGDMVGRSALTRDARY